MIAGTLGDTWAYLSDGANWSGRAGIWNRLGQHMWVSVISLALAVIVALPPALWLGHRRRGGVSRALVGATQSIPPYALLGLLLPISIRFGFGLGFWPTLVTMFVLAVPPVFINTLASMADVDPALLDVADGTGMRAGQRFREVELPLAAPLAVAGIGIAAVQVIATATIGVYVGFVGLGSLLAEGFAQSDAGRTLSGALLVSVPAVLAMALTRAVQRRLTRWRSGAGGDQPDTAASAPH